MFERNGKIIIASHQGVFSSKKRVNKQKQLYPVQPDNNSPKKIWFLEIEWFIESYTKYISYHYIRRIVFHTPGFNGS